MGWDVKASADAVQQAIPALADVSADLANPQVALRFAGALAAIAVLYWLLRPLLQRAYKALEDTVFSNWRLALLGTTGVVLSIASGWTTWDGMWNFTCSQAQASDKASTCFGAGVLSLMITFGIQGVMLIVAWLIGESFATGMNQSAPASMPPGISRTVQGVLGAGIGLLLFIAIFGLIYQAGGGVDLRQAGSADGWGRFADRALIIVVGVLIAALFALYSASDLVRPYLQSSRIMVKNAVLWVMFLACMATSVFFSFDSLFTAIFPQEERVRAAGLRAQNQVAGVVADIGQTIDARKLAEAQALFKSTGWAAYEKQLDKLAEVSQGSQGEIEKYFVHRIEERRRGIAEQQERIATAQSGQAGLAGKKLSLTDELSRIKAERPGLAAEFAQHKSELDAKAREVDAKRVEALAEEKGVEGTGKIGRGQIYRQRATELEHLRAEYKIKEERTKDAQKRLSVVETRIAQIERELSTIDGDLAKLQGEAATAEHRIRSSEASGADAEGAKIDPARVLPAFERAKAEFRQEPTQERLTVLYQQCMQLYNAMSSTPATKDKARGIDCDPKQATEAAGIVFALNVGAQAFGDNCAGGDKLAPHKGTDALFEFARKCLLDSGLPSKETDNLRSKINFMELNRDDKAHRFVVTWNAFGDGNRLAYLALSIAIAIDALVFMSGLFGANALRSPLSDVPSVKARTARQLEAIIENALLPEKFENARATLQAIRPITNQSGFMGEVRPERLDAHGADRVLAVLNAGATIHAVEYDEARHRYLVRAELFEFLSLVAKKAFEADQQHVKLSELEKIVTVALLPNVNETVDAVLQHLHPINETNGFTSEMFISEVERDNPAFARGVRNVLNAGATMHVVQREPSEDGRYYIHADLYKTLARIRARTLIHQHTAAQISGPGGARQGGELTSSPVAVEGPASHQPLLTARLASRPEMGQQQAAGLDDDERDMLDQYVADFVAVLGIEPQLYSRLQGSAFAAALAASEAFSRARQSNKALDVELTARDEQAHMSLDAAYSHLEAGLDAHATAARGLLHDAYREIEENWPVLMLLPQGPYEKVLSSVVESLEPDDASGDLREEEQDLLRAAKRLRSALAANPRDSEQAWRSIDAMLRHAPHQASIELSKRTLN